MKIKACAIVIVIVAIVQTSFCVIADSGSYIVKLKDGSLPVELVKKLTEVNGNRRIYVADNISELNDFNEYIEYVEANDELMLIEGESSASLYSLPNDELYREQWQQQIVNA